MNWRIPYCPKCGHSKHVRWDPATNSFVCVVHGIVLEDSIIDSGPEWRTFDAEDVNNGVELVHLLLREYTIEVLQRSLEQVYVTNVVVSWL